MNIVPPDDVGPALFSSMDMVSVYAVLGRTEL